MRDVDSNPQFLARAAEVLSDPVWVYMVGRAVEHVTLGSGLVTRVEDIGGDVMISIEFDAGGVERFRPKSFLDGFFKHVDLPDTLADPEVRRAIVATIHASDRSHIPEVVADDQDDDPRCVSTRRVRRRPHDGKKDTGPAKTKRSSDATSSRKVKKDLSVSSRSCKWFISGQKHKGLRAFACHLRDVGIKLDTIKYMVQHLNNPGIVTFLGPYYPRYHRNSSVYSDRILKEFKIRKSASVINELALLLNGVLLDAPFVVTVVPSHQASTDQSSTHSTSAIVRLGQSLCRTGKRIDGTTCLIRHKSIPKQAYGGARSKDVHRRSIEFNPKFPSPSRSFLLIDDIMTTGKSIAACKEILLKAGARQVKAVVLAKTVAREGHVQL